MSEFAAQRIIGNGSNAVLTAALTVSAQLPSTDRRLVSSARQGHGQIALAGSYTGAADTTVDIEILSGTGTQLQPSTPVLAGVGSGALQVLALDPAAVPQELTLKLVSAGTPDRPAELPFFGATLRARVAGTSGNALTLEVTRQLVYTPTLFSTLSEIAPGTADLEGPQWDWDAVPADDRRIPRTAPRLNFEGQPQVFRHWRTWEADKWVMHIDPAPLAVVAADTRVLAVSGDYDLELTNGTTTETYTAVTVWDALREIAARSALVEVVGVVAEDRAPGGMAVTDIPLRTDAYAMAVEAQIQGAYGVKRLDSITVLPDAPTETITIERNATGRWSVSGPISGALSDAQTGTPYADGPVGFTIPPAVFPPGVRGEIMAKVGLVPREPEETIPAVCVYPVAGAAATPKQITFTYQRRPAAACDCSNLPAPPVSLACLGLGGIDMAGLPAAHQTRLQTLLAWRAARIASNVIVQPSGVASERDMNLIDSVARIFADPLGQILDSVSALAAWDAALAAMWPELALFDGVSSGLMSPIVPGAAISLPMASEVTVNEIIAVGNHLLCAANGHVYKITAISRTYNASPLSGNFPASPVTNGSTFQVTLTYWSGSAYVTGATVTFQDVGLMKDLPVNIGDQMARKYAAKMDEVKVIAGIAPAFSAASSEAGACWREDEGAAFWWVDLSGEYLPAFTDLAYASARRVNGAIEATYEFGFGMAVACEESLQEGDAITITLQGEGLDGYSAGDRYRLPIVAAAAAPFTGGAAGNPVHTWAMRGSVAGALPDWDWDPDDPDDYAAGPADLRLTAGGIAYVVGDTWTLRLEGGVLRWRRDAGAWTQADLYGTAPNLGNGLTLTITPGASPSFVTGDTWTYTALATYGPDRLRQPREGRGWRWSGAAAVLNIDLGSVRAIEAVLIAMHTLPAGATIAIGGGTLAPTTWTLAPTRMEGPILALPPAGATARYLRITLGNCGAGASIGWVWAGVPWAPTAGCSAMTRVRQYAITRTNGRNQVGLYRGRGMGGRWTWSLNDGGALTGSNADALLALLDHVVEQGLEPVCLVPAITAPASAMLAQIDADEVVLSDELGYALDGQGLVSVDLPFRGMAA